MTLPGSDSGTLFQGWVEELKYLHPGVPLLITETGLSVSPNAANQGPPDYGYGGNTEAEQAAGILQNLSDIDSASIAIGWSVRCAGAGRRFRASRTCENNGLERVA